MNCPYCAEEIKDEAVVCRHCGHDFSIVKSLWLRMLALEEKIKELAVPLVPTSEETAHLQTFAALTAIALCVIFTSGYLFISMAPLPRSILTKVLAVVLPPLVIGFTAELVWKYKHLLAYLKPGFVLGALNLLCIWSVTTSFAGIRFRWVWALFVFLVGQPLTFALSTMVSRSLRNRWSRSSRPKPTGTGKDSDTFEDVTKKLDTTLNLLLKLAGLVGSILGTATAATKLFGGGISS